MCWSTSLRVKFCHYEDNGWDDRHPGVDMGGVLMLEKSEAWAIGY